MYNLGALRAAMRANAQAASRSGARRKSGRASVSAAGGRVTVRAAVKKARRAEAEAKESARAAHAAAAAVVSASRGASKRGSKKGSKRKSKRTSRPGSKRVGTRRSRASRRRGTRKAASKPSSKPSSKRKSRRSKRGSKRTSKRKSKRTSKRRGGKRSSRKGSKRTSRKGSKRRGSKRKGSKRGKRRGSRKGSRKGDGRRFRGMSAEAAKALRSGKYPNAYRTARLFDAPRAAYGRPTEAARQLGQRLVANLLASTGPGSGQAIQVVELKPGSKRRGYPVYVPGHVTPKSYVRKFTFGGVAKRAHASKGSWRGQLLQLLQAAERRPRTSKRKGSKRTSRKKGSKRTSSKKTSRRGGSRRAVKKNRRTPMARRRRSKRSTRRNPNYVIVNGRRRRRVKRNGLMDLARSTVQDIGVPAGVATGGFLAANAIANLAANSDSVRNLLDAGKSPDQALLTKSLVNAGAIMAALGASQMRSTPALVRQYATPGLIGMGLSLFARLLRGTTLAPYLGRLGEYVEQPMGEYVSQPMGAYVNDPSMGEYVSQPMNGLGSTFYAAAGLGSPTLYAAAGYAEGIDPANQEGVDGLMDVMEAAAGTPVMEAAAGMGLGSEPYMGEGEADASLAKMYSKMQPAWASIQEPTDLARAVDRTMPRDLPIPTSLVTPEGKGWAGGLFSRHLFGGML